MSSDATSMVRVGGQPGREASGLNFKALVVDDDADVRTYISRVLQDFDLKVDEAEKLEPAARLLGRNSYCMAFVDKCLPDGDGVEFSRVILERCSGLPIVIITGQGSGREAEEALDSGVFDYIPKPCSPKEVREVVSKILRRYLVRNEEPRTTIAYEIDDRPQLVGRSKAMVEVMKDARRAAQMSVPVLIQGATGTGKEVLARFIHSRSARAGERFVPINCGAIPGELIESELFGHVKGAFTGADRPRKGLFEEAEGGTIFLDEITETTPSFQVKLLRVLQEGTIRKVGSSQETRLDVRVVAASNRDVMDEVANGRFREDLFYRLKGAVIRLPLLKDRAGDVMDLAEYFAARASMQIEFSQQVEDALLSYDWPGNVRELESVIRVAVQSCDGEVIMSDLPADLRRAVGFDAPGDEREFIGVSRRFKTLKDQTRAYILRVLNANGGNMSRTAKELGVDRHVIYRRLAKGGQTAGDSKVGGDLIGAEDE